MYAFLEVGQNDRLFQMKWYFCGDEIVNQMLGVVAKRSFVGFGDFLCKIG